MMNLPTGMHKSIAKSVRLTLIVGGFLFTVSMLAQETPEAAKPAEEKAGLPDFKRQKSVFVVEPREMENKITRDPFFPQSMRRNPIPKGPTEAEKAAAAAAAKAKAEAEAAAAAAARKAIEPPDPFNDLELKGVISGRRPMATIFTRHKNYLFSPGEWRMVKVPNVKNGELREIRLECVSITGDEVTVKLENKLELRTLSMPVSADDDGAN